MTMKILSQIMSVEIHKINLSVIKAGDSSNKSKSLSYENRRPNIYTKVIQNVADDESVRRAKTIPGNSTYASITNKGKKTLIIGASLIKHIKMGEFNKHIKNGYAIKRSYPGIHWHIISSFIDYKPDSVIINIGTNNLTKKRLQREEEICADILKIVEKCQEYGVNEIYVSGLTCRPKFQEKIEKINGILRVNANTHDYTFIDNSNITRNHLRDDGLHLLEKGNILLANNFLSYLNYWD